MFSCKQRLQNLQKAMNCITVEVWNGAHSFVQEESLAQNGVDISDPSKLSDGQWTLVCAQQKFLPSEIVRPCSAELASLFDAGKDRCVTASNNSTELEKLAEKQLMKADEAMCQSVHALVRSHVAVPTRSYTIGDQFRT